jgi:hypothetical protein
LTLDPSPTPQRGTHFLIPDEELATVIRLTVAGISPKRKHLHSVVLLAAIGRFFVSEIGQLLLKEESYAKAEREGHPAQEAAGQLEDRCWAGRGNAQKTSRR